MLIYSAKKQNCLKEMQEFYDYFVTQTKLGPDMCVIFCYDPDRTLSELPKAICKFKNKKHKWLIVIKQKK